MTSRLASVLLALCAAGCASAGDASSSADPGHRVGANPGRPANPDDFRRAGPGCSCPSDPDLGSCRCLHCADRPGAQCYCQQKTPKACLCGLDMPACSCVHCSGRAGEGCDVCPCDHSATRAKLGTR